MAEVLKIKVGASYVVDVTLQLRTANAASESTDDVILPDRPKLLLRLSRASSHNGEEGEEVSSTVVSWPEHRLPTQADYKDGVVKLRGDSTIVTVPLRLADVVDWIGCAQPSDPLIVDSWHSAADALPPTPSSSFAAHLEQFCDSAEPKSKHWKALHKRLGQVAASGGALLIARRLLQRLLALCEKSQAHGPDTLLLFARHGCFSAALLPEVVESFLRCDGGDVTELLQSAPNLPEPCLVRILHARPFVDVLSAVLKCPFTKTDLLAELRQNTIEIAQGIFCRLQEFLHETDDSTQQYQGALDWLCVLLDAHGLALASDAAACKEIEQFCELTEHMNEVIDWHLRYRSLFGKPPSGKKKNKQSVLKSDYFLSTVQFAPPLK